MITGFLFVGEPSLYIYGPVLVPNFLP